MILVVVGGMLLAGGLVSFGYAGWWVDGLDLVSSCSVICG